MGNTKKCAKRGRSLFSLDNIMRAFSKATLDIKKASQVIGVDKVGILGADTGFIYDFFGRDDKETDRVNQNKCNQSEFVRVWISNELCTTFVGRAQTDLDNLRSKICVGHYDVSTTNFVDRLVRPKNVCKEIEARISVVLKVHIASILCFLFDTRCVTDSFSRVKNFAESKKGMKMHEAFYPVFVESVLETLILDIEKIKADPRFKCGLLDKLVDKSRNSETSIEKLAKITLFALITDRIATEELCERVYQDLYSVDMNQRISKETIVSAGRRWYENTKKEGHRFAKLIPNIDLLPLAGTLCIQDQEGNENVCPLMDCIKSTPGNLYLIGEGGMGKTTALYRIMEEAYAFPSPTDQQIPLYIELSRASRKKDFEIGDSFGESKFVRHSILRQIVGSNGFKEDANLLDKIEVLFKKNNSNPEYVFLLDGLNEVSRDEIGGYAIIQMLMAEIRFIMSNYPNVRVILTSRSKESLGEKITPLYLTGITYETVERYLKKRNDNRILHARNNRQLMSLLKVPLFLILYSELEGEDEYLSRGEILHAFFSKRKEGQYSDRNRIYIISDAIVDETGTITNGGATPEMLSFMLDFLLPEIAWDMVKNCRFQIDRDRIAELAKDLLTKREDTSICGKYGNTLFAYTDVLDTRTVAKDIKGTFKKGIDDEDEKWDNITINLCICLKSQLGVLKTNDSFEYEFVHHHVRDYFAALHHINRLKLACYIFQKGDANAARECLIEWKNNPLLLNQLSFIGECLGELHNVPVYDDQIEKWVYNVPVDEVCDRNLIKRAFDIYRYRFDEKDGYAVWNLFQVLKLTRKDLSGEDFSNLDLFNCRANGFRLSNGDLACKLRGSKLNDSFFMPMGHNDRMVSAEYSPDGMSILTVFQDGMMIRWDAKTFQEICRIKFAAEWETIESAHCSPPDGKYLIMKSDNGFVRVFDRIRLFILLAIDDIYSAMFSPDGEKVLLAGADGFVKEWDSRTRETINVPWHLSCCFASYSPQGKFVFFLNVDGNLEVLDRDTFRMIPDGALKETPSKDVYTDFDGSPILVEEGSPYAFACSHDEKYIVTAGRECIKMWEIGGFSKGPRFSLKHLKFVNSLQFSPDDRYIVICSEGEVFLLDSKTFDIVPAIDLPKNIFVKFAQYSPKGHYLMLNVDGTIHIWDAITYQAVPGGRLSINTMPLGNVEVSPDGHLLVAVFGDRKEHDAVFYDIETSQTIPLIDLKGISTVRFSPSGEYYVTTSSDNTAKMWDAKIHHSPPKYVINGHADEVLYADFSPDEGGKYIVTSSLDGTSRIWDATVFKKLPVQTLQEDEKSGAPCFAQFSPNGKSILTRTVEGDVSLWRLEPLRKTKIKPNSLVLDLLSKGILVLYPAPFFDCAELLDYRTSKPIPGSQIVDVNQVAFSKDEKRIVVINEDGLVEVLSADSHQVLSRKINHPGVCMAQFCSNDRYIVTSSLDGVIKLWDSHTYKELRAINAIPGLEVWNVDVRNRHQASRISLPLKNRLKENGAIVD